MGVGVMVGRWWERVAGLAADAGAGTARGDVGERKTTAVPGGLGYAGDVGAGFGGGFGAGSVLFPFRAGGVTPQLPKPTAGNLRRLAETPAARRAMNCIKDRIACMDWRVEVQQGAGEEGSGDRRQRALRLTRALARPNGSDSFRTLIEAVIEDTLVGGFGAIEVEPGDERLPVRLYPVDGATIQVNPDWDGRPETPRYAQVTGRLGADGRTELLDRELVYLRLNPRSHTMFGLGKMEVAFEAITSFLGAQKYAGRMASSGTVPYALWLKDRTPEQHERLTRWWQEEVEGSGHVPVLSTEEAPQVIRLAEGSDAELRLQWQEFLLTMVANAFDLPPMVLGVTANVNRSTAKELADEAFQNAVVPLAKLIADYLTRDVISKVLGWDDLRFCWSELESRDEATEVSVQVQLLQAGVLTVDEVRAMRGLAARGSF